MTTDAILDDVILDALLLCHDGDDVRRRVIVHRGDTGLSRIDDAPCGVVEYTVTVYDGAGVGAEPDTVWRVRGGIVALLDCLLAIGEHYRAYPDYLLGEDEYCGWLDSIDWALSSFGLNGLMMDGLADVYKRFRRGANTGDNGGHVNGGDELYTSNRLVEHPFIVYPMDYGYGSSDDGRVNMERHGERGWITVDDDRVNVSSIHSGVLDMSVMFEPLHRSYTYVLTETITTLSGGSVTRRILYRATGGGSITHRLTDDTRITVKTEQWDTVKFLWWLRADYDSGILDAGALTRIIDTLVKQAPIITPNIPAGITRENITSIYPEIIEYEQSLLAL